jgi:extradiol dioxygenase family protein
VQQLHPAFIPWQQQLIRLPRQPSMQWTMFFHDPSGNALEFKAMTKPENLFAKYIVNGG